LQSGERHHKYRLLKAADTFFDDKDHFEEMRWVTIPPTFGH